MSRHTSTGGPAAGGTQNHTYRDKHLPVSDLRPERMSVGVRTRSVAPSGRK